MAEVIDWDQAMEQCGEDEEFLRELLGDLRDELDTQLSNIETFLNVSKICCFIHIHRVPQATSLTMSPIIHHLVSNKNDNNFDH